MNTSGNEQNTISGVNLSDVRYKCSKICNNYYELTNDFVTKIGEFFFELSNVWGSEKAVIFSERMEINVNQALTNIRKEYQNMLDKISSAARSWIYRLGLSESVPSYSVSSRTCTSISLKDNVNGIKGMKLKMVDDLLNTRLNKMISSADGILNTLPSSISLYDESNGQQIAFLQNAKKIRGTVDEIIQMISNEIRNIIKEEQLVLEEAAKQSISEINQNL